VNNCERWYGWGARIRTWEWRNQNPLSLFVESRSILKNYRFLPLAASIAGAVLGLAGTAAGAARETPVGPFTALGSNQTNTAVEVNLYQNLIFNISNVALYGCARCV
jgi:hypothetical protein